MRHVAVDQHHLPVGFALGVRLGALRGGACGTHASLALDVLNLFRFQGGTALHSIYLLLLGDRLDLVGHLPHHILCDLLSVTRMLELL